MRQAGVCQRCKNLMNDGRVHLVQGPMCHWRLSSTGDGDEQEFVRGKTRWATSSSRLATLLAREHAGENRRVRLIGRDDTIAASMYSPRFVNEALRASGSSWSTTDGWTAFVCTQLDRQQTFLSWYTRMARRRLRSAGKFARSDQGQGRKERRNRVGVEAEAL